MRIARIVIAVLLGVLVGGPTLLDRCLVNCHGQSGAASTEPSCHDAGGSRDGVSVHGVAGCDHDHDAMVADSPSDSRVSSAGQRSPHAALAATAGVAILPFAPAMPRRLDAGQLPRPPASRIVPLRV